MIRKVLIGCAIAFLSSFVAADILEDLAKDPDILSAKISPKGDYLAVLREVEDKRVVVIFTFPELKYSSIMAFPGRNEVGNYWWANDERVVASVLRNYDRLEEESSLGELFAMNADGKKSEHLFGFRAGADSTSFGHVKRKSNEYGFATIIDMLWDDPKHVLIEIRNYSGSITLPVESARLNIYNGRVQRRVPAPAANSQLVSDREGKVRFAYSIDDDQNSVIHFRNPKSNKWEEFSRTPYGKSETQLISLHEDGRIWVGYEPDGGARGIYLMDANTQEKELIHQPSRANSTVEFDREHNAWGVFDYDSGKSHFVPVDEGHPLSKVYKKLKRAFPKSTVGVSSTTHDYKSMIVAVYPDPGTAGFYVFNTETNELQLLFESRPWIDKGKLPSMKVVDIEARDGLLMQGYLSLPPGSDGKNMPFVIVPHGGPHGPRDYWGNGWETFIPASGYAMLRVNYRGSGGYGTAFETAGHREWPGKMQDDLTDSVRWAIEQGIADPERICIFGWSYGGYAAAMSIVREPDLYKCSVAGAGVYDQDEQYRNADFTTYTRWGRKYIDKVIGPTKEDRAQASPANFVERIKTPLLLIHGEEDQRVPIEHSYIMQKAYEKAGKKPPRLILLKNEAHSPRKEENVVEFTRETIAFFEKYIGPGEFGPET